MAQHKFKVGDIVKPNPQWWSDPDNLRQRPVVVWVGDDTLKVHCKNKAMNDIIWGFKDFIQCEESIIDKLLEKYS